MDARMNVTFVLDECVITTTIDHAENIPAHLVARQASKVVTSYLGLATPVEEISLDVITEEA